MTAYPLYPTRGVHCLDGLWDFAFLGESVDLDSINPETIRFTERTCVPGCFDALPAYAGKRGTAAYRLRFNARPDVCALLKFGGLGMWARVYADGVALRECSLPYSGFTVELPPSPGAAPHPSAEREIIVVVDNRFDFARVPLQEQFFDFYAYGGIFRSVEYMEVPEIRIDRVRVSVQDLAAGRVRLRAILAGDEEARTSAASEAATTAILRVGFDGEPPHPLAFTRVKSDDAGTAAYEATATLTDKTPWTPDAPHLHTVRVELPADGSSGAATDCVLERFGLRTVRAENGAVLLNGEPIKLLGYCRHEAHPQYGPALPLAQLVADLQLLKDLGCNFVRGSHYPQDPRWLDLCDEHGILVFEESMGWGQRERHFASEAWCRAQIEQTRLMVANSYNHPSVIIWGFLNEGQSNFPGARGLYADLASAIRAEDRSRLVTYASMFPFDDLCLDLVDLISVNKYPGWYADDMEAVRPLAEIRPLLDRLLASFRERGFGHKPVIISEMGAGAIYGWRDSLNAHWTEDYQADYLAEVCGRIVENDDFAGVSLWQFCDCRTYASGHALKRPRAFNNKGTLDEYRRPKLAYKVVKGLFKR